MQVRLMKPKYHPDAVVRMVIGRGGFTGEISLVVPSPNIWSWYMRDRMLLLFTYFNVHPLMRGHGWGRCLLQFMVRYADRHGIDLVTYAEPYDGGRVGQTKLAHLYRSYGFGRRDRDGFMVRRCRT